MKKIRELFRNTKLNIKFTSIIILFMVIPIGVLAGVLFYVMEQNAVQELSLIHISEPTRH